MVWIAPHVITTDRRVLWDGSELSRISRYLDGEELARYTHARYMHGPTPMRSLGVIIGGMPILSWFNKVCMSRQTTLTGEPIEAPVDGQQIGAASKRTVILDAAPPDTSWRRVARWIVRAREEHGKEAGLR